jgi:hypothetical protein
VSYTNNKDLPLVALSLANLWAIVQFLLTSGPSGRTVYTLEISVDFATMTASYSSVEKLVEENPGFPIGVKRLKLEVHYSGGGALTLEFMGAFFRNGGQGISVSDSREWSFGILESANHLLTQLADSNPSPPSTPSPQAATALGVPQLPEHAPPHTQGVTSEQPNGARAAKRIAIPLIAAAVAFAFVFWLRPMQPDRAGEWAAAAAVIAWIIQFAYDRYRET